MKVTNVFVKANPSNSKTKGYGSVEFDGQVSINFTIFPSNQGGDFVSWPKYKKTDGSYSNHVFFKDEAFKASVDKQVLDKFTAVSNSAEPSVANPPGFDSTDEIPF